MCCVQFRRRFRQGEADALILRDQLTEGLAGLGVFQRLFQRPAAIADRAGRVIDPTDGDPIDRGCEPLMQAANKLPRLDLDVFKTQFGLVSVNTAKIFMMRSIWKPGLLDGTKKALMPLPAPDPVRAKTMQ